MRSFWKVWVGAKTESKALRVFEQVRRNLGAEPLNQVIEPYPKTGGFVIRFEMELVCGARNDCVMETIEMGQRVGYAWILAGDIRRDPSGWSNESSVSGVSAIAWALIDSHAADRVT